MKNVKTQTLLCAAATLMLAAPAIAQDAVNADEFLRDRDMNAPAETAAPSPETPAEPTEVEKGIAEAKAENEDEKTLKKKLDLAKEMHDIRPTRVQVDSAVMQASMGMPAQNRQQFVNAMRGMLNYNAIERISIDAMVETYTLKELDSMVGYYSKPEAKSATSKIVNYASLIQPEIARMIDKAMMRIRTGQ